MTKRKTSTTPARRAARAKAAAMREAERRRRRRRIAASVAGAVAAVAAVAAAVWFVLASPTAGAGPRLDSGGALLATTRHQAAGPTVDKIVSSDSAERIRYHIHAHLTVFVGNRRKALPYGVGIVPPYTLETVPGGTKFVAGGKAFYFLHTHDETGIVHVESPDVRQYTLRNFFDVWRQPLGPHRVGPASGTVRALVDGRPYTGDPGSIVLTDHEEIQLDVNSAAPFAPFAWPKGY